MTLNVEAHLRPRLHRQVEPSRASPPDGSTLAYRRQGARRSPPGVVDERSVAPDREAIRMSISASEKWPPSSPIPLNPATGSVPRNAGHAGSPPPGQRLGSDHSSWSSCSRLTRMRSSVITATAPMVTSSSRCSRARSNCYQLDSVSMSSCTSSTAPSGASCPTTAKRATTLPAAMRIRY